MEAGQVIVEVVADTTKLKEGLQDANQQIINTGKVSQQTAQVYTAANEQMAESTESVVSAASDLGQAFKGIPNAALKQGFDELGNAANKAANGIKTVTGQIRANRNSLAELRLAGKEATDEYRNLERENAKLNLAMEQTREVVKNTSAEFKGLSAGREAVRGISAAMEGAAGASLLFGGENSKAAEKVQQLIGATLILNSAFEVANTLKETGTVKTYVYATAQKAAAAAEELFAAGIAATTLAATAFVGGIAAVAYGIYTLITSEKEHEKQQIKFKQRIEGENIALDDQIEIYKILGKSVDELDKRKRDLERQTAKNEQSEIIRKETSGFSALYNSIKSQLGGGINVLSKDAQEAYKKQSDAIKVLDNKDKEDKIKNAEEAGKLYIQNQEKQLVLVKNGFAKEVQLYDNATAEGRIALKEKNKDIKDSEDARQALVLYNQERDKERGELFRKYNLEEEKKTIESKLELISKGSDDENKLRKQLAKNQEQSVLTNPNSSIGDKAEAEQVYIKQLQQINRDTLAVRYAQREEAIKGELALVKEGSGQELALKQQLLRTELAAGLSLAYDDEKKRLQLTEEEAKAEADLRVKYSKEAIEKARNIQTQSIERQLSEAQNTYQRSLIGISQKEGQQKSSLTGQTKEQALEIEKEKTEAYLQNLKEQEDAAYKISENSNSPTAYEDLQKTLLDIKQKRIDAENKLTEDQAAYEREQIKSIGLLTLQTGAKVITEITDAQNKATQQRISNEISRLNEQRSFELNNANLTAAQKAALDVKYRKQEAALKLQAWTADQKAQEEKAVISTALAIINALATSPYPINIALAAAAAATGGAQVAVIASQKPPQFYAQGTEYVTGPGTGTSDSVPAMLSRGERIVPADINTKLKNIPNIDLPNLVYPDLSNESSIPRTGAIDYDKLGESIGEQLAKQPKVHIGFDKRGFYSWIANGRSRTDILNNKYKW